jgi:hypothetical protein
MHIGSGIGTIVVRSRAGSSHGETVVVGRAVLHRGSVTVAASARKLANFMLTRRHGRVNHKQHEVGVKRYCVQGLKIVLIDIYDTYCPCETMQTPLPANSAVHALRRLLSFNRKEKRLTKVV